MMKVTLLAATLVFVFTGSMSAQSAKTNKALEQEIRKLEQMQVDSLLRGDLAAIRDNWAKDYVVNNPFNVVVDAINGPIQAGTLTYSSFVKEIERVVIHDKIVIVMGNETVVPKGTSPDAGATIHRRFTDIWMKKKEKWLLIARHASVVCPK